MLIQSILNNLKMLNTVNIIIFYYQMIQHLRGTKQ